MDWLSQIMELVIIPILGVLTAFIIKYINLKSEELILHSDNKIYQKYIAMLNQTITNCVIATNQTYVNSLKQSGQFDADAQKEAFNRTYETVIKILSDDAVMYLNEAINDLNLYITQEIEAKVNLLKE